MDEQVLRSLIKWPQVPDCFAWLALDRRGQWRMRDEYAQMHQLPGKVIEHVGLKEYIARNYAHDDQGRYFFQNGPQRVFISLDATPWIARMIPSATGMQLMTQCNTPIKPLSALSDEIGNIYITGLVQQETLSVALLHDHDLDLFSSQAKVYEDACSFRGSWNWDGQELPIEPIHSAELSERFHFVKVPSNTLDELPPTLLL